MSNKLLNSSLEKLLRLEPKTYYMKTDEYDFMNFSKTKQFGLIAQDVQEVFPELVQPGTHPAKVDQKTGETIGQDVNFIGMDYTGLTPIMIQAIKEQQAQIEELKKMLEAQQLLINELKNK